MPGDNRLRCQVSLSPPRSVLQLCLSTVFMMSSSAWGGYLPAQTLADEPHALSGPQVKTPGASSTRGRRRRMPPTTDAAGAGGPGLLSAR